MAATVGETDFVTLKSDSANTSIDALDALFWSFVSVSLTAESATALVYVPAPPFASAVSVRVGVAPTAMVPTSQKPVALSNVPWLGVAETKSSPAGSTSVKRTPVAGLGPEFDAVRSKLTVAVRGTTSPPLTTFVMPTSTGGGGSGATCTPADAALLSPFGSVTPGSVIEAPFPWNPVAVAVVKSSSRTDTPGGSGPTVQTPATGS